MKIKEIESVHALVCMKIPYVDKRRLHNNYQYGDYCAILLTKGLKAESVAFRFYYRLFVLIILKTTW